MKVHYQIPTDVHGGPAPPRNRSATVQRTTCVIQAEWFNCSRL